jgi:hypothetical protein
MLIVRLSNWSGRLSNNIYQISNAIKYAQLHNGIFINDLNHSLIKNFSINFSNETTAAITEVYCQEFFFTNRDKLTLGERREICNKYILPNFLVSLPKTISNISNKLYLQIRGEDAFYFTNGSAYYQQPPLCFYTYIIETFKYSDLEIITKDMNNPCTKKLLELYPHTKLTFKSLKEDLEDLLSAENVLFSSGGQFGKMILLSSNNIKNAYTCYNSQDEIDDPILVEFNHTKTITDFKIYNYLINNYIHFKDWNGTKQNQVDLMISLDKSNIEFIGINNT